MAERIHDVPLVPQTTAMSCWAASIAMILGWRNSQSIADVTIARNTGGNSYLPELRSGLDPNDRYILKQNGFALDAPMCYTLPLVQGMIEDHGPLWVASAAPAPHIRVVRGYRDNILYINDPAPQNVGARYTRPFSRFFGRMETLGGQELKEPAPIYVAYLERAAA